MITAYLAYKFAGLWALIWHFGLGGGIAILCFAAAYFSPIFKKDFLWAGITMVVIVVSVAVGVQLGENRVQAQWDVARANALKIGQDARAGAVRDVARKPSKWLPNHADRYQRD